MDQECVALLPRLWVSEGVAPYQTSLDSGGTGSIPEEGPIYPGLPAPVII